jgi:cytochrome c biogenesis factor
VLFALRAPALRSTGTFAPISRESALVLNNMLLATAALTVFLGTLYPLFLDVIGGDKVSVGVALLQRDLRAADGAAGDLVMAAGPLMTWKRADLPGVLMRLRLAFGGALAVAVVMIIVTKGHEALAPLGLGLAAWLLFGTLRELAGRIRCSRRRGTWSATARTPAARRLGHEPRACRPGRDHRRHHRRERLAAGGDPDPASRARASPSPAIPIASTRSSPVRDRTMRPSARR